MSTCGSATSMRCATGGTRRNMSRACGGCCRSTRPDDFVLATGTGYSVREFLALAFDQVGLDWEKYVRFDERYLRPAEVDAVIGDASKANSLLGWKPQVQTPELVKIMVEADIRALEARPIWIDRPGSRAGRHPADSSGSASVVALMCEKPLVRCPNSFGSEIFAVHPRSS